MLPVAFAQRTTATTDSDIYKPVFIMQFIVLVALFFVKLYNVLKLGEFYDWKIMFLTLVGLILTFGVGMLTSIIYFDNLLIMQMFNFEVLIFIAGFMLFITELIILFKDALFVKTRDRYRANKKI